jgi:hypothetical protein
MLNGVFGTKIAVDELSETGVKVDKIQPRGNRLTRRAWLIVTGLGASVIFWAWRGADRGYSWLSVVALGGLILIILALGFVAVELWRIRRDVPPNCCLLGVSVGGHTLVEVFSLGRWQLMGRARHPVFGVYLCPQSGLVPIVRVKDGEVLQTQHLKMMLGRNGRAVYLVVQADERSCVLRLFGAAIQDRKRQP